MRHLTEPGREGWIAVHDDTNESELIRRIKTADFLISDLDDTDTPSPAKHVAYESLLKPGRVIDPRFWAWSAGTAIALLKDGEDSHVPRWMKFKDQFLNTPKAKQELRDTYTPQHAAMTLYPGVQQFYLHFCRGVRKTYLTGNIPEITEGYRRANAFDDMLCDQYDKARGIEALLAKHLNLGRIIIKGNSLPDEEALDVAKAYKRRGIVEDAIGINVCASAKDYNPAFDINIGQDYRALAWLLRGKGND